MPPATLNNQPTPIRLLAGLALRDLLRLLASVALCTAVLLPLLEVALRVFSRPPFTLGYLRTHPTRRYELVPNFRGMTYDAPLRINSLGLRDDERPPQPGALRIAVLGDSISFGQGVRAKETFAAVLEERLNAKTAQRPVQVLNLSTPGYNTMTEWLQLKETYDRFRPDLIFVQFSLADDTVPVPPSSANQVAALRVVKDVLRSLYIYDQMAQRFYTLRRSLPQALLAYRHQPAPSALAQLSALYDDDNPGWRECQQALQHIAAFGRDHHIPVVIGVIAFSGKLARSAAAEPIYPVIARLDARLDSLGLTQHLLLDDALRAYSGNERLLRVKEDDLHPSPLAHRLIAERLADFLTPLLADLR